MTTARAAQGSSQSEADWTSTQAYVLAVFCLALGVALGYLFRGSASPDANPGNTATETSGSAPQGMPGAAGTQPTPAQLKEMFDRASAPLLDALKKNPNDFDSIVQLGNLYYDGKQYPQAIEYYERALKIQPKNADVITDMGTAYWYTGNADRAITEFKKSLTIRPDHPGTLFNMGVVQWQGKNDPGAAIEAWEQLLKTNPNYPQKQQVEDFIEKAKQHIKG